jgi:multidrug efflux pump subunit AcrA (membrane-fusion protein)
VISDGPARVGKHSVEVGGRAQVGAPVTTLTSTTPVVTAKLDAGLAADVHRGDPVRVTMPDGGDVGGRITRVGTVATAGQEGDSSTVELRVALNGHQHGRLDGAPVSVSLETGRTKDALAVPVTALVATAPGRYAVELAGSHRLVPVTPGAFADDWVQVTGAGLAPGTRVVVPR